MQVHYIKHIETKEMEFDVDYYEEVPDEPTVEDQTRMNIINLVIWGGPFGVALLDKLLQ